MELTSLFGIEPEKYWSLPVKYSDQEKKDTINNRILSGDYIGSEKRDGDYNKFVKDFDGTVHMETRTISKITGTYTDKKDHVPHISSNLDKLLPSGTILIGELCFEDRTKTSQDVATILRCKAEKAANRQISGEYPYLHYYIHDIWYYGGESFLNKPYGSRVTFILRQLKPLLEHISYFEFPEYAFEPVEINELMNDVFSRNGEGIVLCRKDGIVEPGKRPAWKTIKVKRELDNFIDCFFTGVVNKATRLYTGSEIENWMYWEDVKTGARYMKKLFLDFEAGRPIEPVTHNYFFFLPGSLEIGVMKDGEVVPIGNISGIPEEIKGHYKEYSMKPIEVTAMMKSNDGNLRHPKFKRFRDDIGIEDCTWEKYIG